MIDEDLLGKLRARQCTIEAEIEEIACMSRQLLNKSNEVKHKIDRMISSVRVSFSTEELIDFNTELFGRCRTAYLIKLMRSSSTHSLVVSKLWVEMVQNLARPNDHD